MTFFNQTKSNKQKTKPVVNYSEVEPENRSEKQSKKVDQSQSLRELPTEIAQSFTTEVVGGVMDGFMRQLLGQPSVSPEVLNQPKGTADHEALMWKKKFQMAEKRRQEEKAFYIQKEQESQQRLMTVRQELQVQMSSMSKDMATWAQEVEIATFQAPVSPDVYHVNFFEMLLAFVKNLRKRVKRSRQWLKALNDKKTNKKGLWGMAKKGNTYDQEILYSGERAVSMGG